MMNELDLYAKVEEILGFDEAAYKLYSEILDVIDGLEIKGKKALDFGCGSGKFAKILSDEFEVVGIDKSDLMVQKAKSLGIDARHITLDKMDEKFDLITATFDVLNYMNDSELSKFLTQIPNRLNDGGYFIFDINTLHGFSEVAQGLLYENDDENELIIDAVFEDEILKTKIVYFEKLKDSNSLNLAKSSEIYHKISKTITQYFHTNFKIQKSLNLQLFKEKKIRLYDKQTPDKVVLVYQNKGVKF